MKKNEITTYKMILAILLSLFTSCRSYQPHIHLRKVEPCDVMTFEEMSDLFSGEVTRCKLERKYKGKKPHKIEIPCR